MDHMMSVILQMQARAPRPGTVVVPAAGGV
jgi:hypothetical protein